MTVAFAMQTLYDQDVKQGPGGLKYFKAQGHMLAARKLVLVLDLDHTLLNSATHHELSQQVRRG